MIERKFEEANILMFKKKASTVFAFNDVVTTDANGFLVRATSATPRAKLLGLIQREVLATDADYASATMVEVDVFCSDENVYTATVDAGTATQAMVNTFVDLNDENGINVNTNTQQAVKIVKYISATKVEVTFNRGGAGSGARLESIQQTITVAQFTDGGGASGTKSLAGTIPAGAIVVQSFITDVTGFAGNVSAVATIGDGTIANRYNTGTPDVFTTATDISAGAVSGIAFHSTAKTPVVTVTTATDFTLAVINGAGQMTVTILYYVVR